MAAGQYKSRRPLPGPWVPWKGYSELWFLARLAQMLLNLFPGKISGRGWGQQAGQEDGSWGKPGMVMPCQTGPRLTSYLWCALLTCVSSFSRFCFKVPTTVWDVCL